MYAIRSYYAIAAFGAVACTIFGTAAAVTGSVAGAIALARKNEQPGCAVRCIKEDAVAGSAAMSGSIMSRITSYNVCYTKLLRRL